MWDITLLLSLDTFKVSRDVGHKKGQVFDVDQKKGSTILNIQYYNKRQNLSVRLEFCIRNCYSSHMVYSMIVLLNLYRMWT